MDGCFTSSFLACTELDGSSSFLNVCPEGSNDSFSDGSPCCFTNTNGTHTWVLSSAIRRHAVRGAIPCGSTYVVDILFATRARLLQRSAEGHWKDVHSCFHPTASRSEGPAEPFVRMAALRMAIPLMDSNKTGWTSRELSQGEAGYLGVQADLVGVFCQFITDSCRWLLWTCGH